MKETLNSRGKQLSVVIQPPTKAGAGFALSLHGGGLSTKESTDYLSRCFTDRGFGWVSFDCSGWGESAGRRDECSLADRLDDALTVIRHYGLTLDFLIGTSMGGYVAVKLLEAVHVDHLILICPAAYAVSAWSLKFGGGFTDDIRRKDSFLETDAGELCAGFTGNALYLIGDRDEVIPKEIDRLYSTSFRQAHRFRKVVLDDCPHPIHRWAADKPAVIEKIHSHLANFIDARTAPPA